MIIIRDNLGSFGSDREEKIKNGVHRQGHTNFFKCPKFCETHLQFLATLDG